MGKNEKMARKDKINNLRKKYDDFMEDDKKRKDRNVYILERLERMRSSVATLQINRKGIALGHNKSLAENPFFTSSPTSINNQIIRRRDVMNYRENSWDDSSMFKEISKKYILIPKIHTLITTSSGAYPLVDMENNQSDWKNKYDILEQLKGNEKKEPPEKDVTLCLRHQDNCSNETHISKLPIAENIDESKFTNRHDIVKSQYHSSNAIKELVMMNDKATKKRSSANTSIDFQGDKKKNGSFDAREIDNIVMFNQETNQREADNEKKHKEVKVSELKFQNSDKNKQELVVKNIYNEMKIENKEANETDLMNNGGEQNNQIKGTKEIKTNISQNSDESSENETQTNEMATKQDEILYSASSQEVIEDNQAYEKTEINETETKQDEIFYSGKSKQVIGENQGYEQPVINEMQTKQDAIFYSEDSKQVIGHNQAYEQPDIYATDSNYTNDQYNYLEQSQLQQAQDEPYTNIANENQEANANYGENHEQQYVNTCGNEYANHYENQTYDNYETHNDYDQNLNIQYQEPERQENTEYINSENYIQSEPTQEINLSNNQEQYYNEPYAGDTHSQHEKDEYVEQRQKEIQPQINDVDNCVESQENNINGDVAENLTGIEHEWSTVHHDEYAAQDYEENQQQVNVDNSYLNSEENIKEDNIFNHEMQDMEQDVLQSHSENPLDPLQDEGGYEEKPEST